MKSRLRLSLLAPTLVAVIASNAPSARAADDAELLGCWRSQQTRTVFANRGPEDGNDNCVTLFDGRRRLSRCRQEDGSAYTVESDYEIVGPGRLRMTPVEAPAGKPEPPLEISYRIEGDWLITDQIVPAHGEAGSDRPDRYATMSVREVDSACQPRGTESRGRAFSSLAMRTPAGWKPLGLNPTRSPSLHPLVRDALFVGGFVPATASGRSTEADMIVLVTDEVVGGASGLHAASMEDLRLAIDKTHGETEVPCSRPGAVCTQTDGASGTIYGEMLIVRGRPAKVIAMLPPGPFGAAADKAALRRAVTTFVDQLRADNP